MTDARCWAVVPAAGVGKRMGASVPKQYLPLAERPLIEHTIERLLAHPQIQRVCVALSADDGWWPDTAFADHPRVLRAEGGAERSDSVLNGLLALSGLADEDDWVLVHDAARPLLRVDDIERLILRVRADGNGGILGLPVHDTMKQVADRHIEKTLPREQLWHAFTPQMFRLGQLRDALTDARKQGLAVTDEASAMELAGHRPLMVEGHPDNLKVTRPQDLPLAAFYLSQQD